MSKKVKKQSNLKHIAGYTYFILDKDIPFISGMILISEDDNNFIFSEKLKSKNRIYTISKNNKSYEIFIDYKIACKKLCEILENQIDNYHSIIRYEKTMTNNSILLSKNIDEMIERLSSLYSHL